VTRHTCEFIQAVKRNSTFPHFVNGVIKGCTCSTTHIYGCLTGSGRLSKSGLEENNRGEVATVGKTWREVKE